METPFRKPRPISEPQLHLFDAEQSVDESYGGMPECRMGNCSPARRVVVNFLTAEHVREFSKAIGIPITDRSDSIWFPDSDRLRPMSFYYDGPKTPSRYPVYIPSKGRAKVATTPKMLDRLGVAWMLFVEPQEYDDYAARFGESRVHKLPFSNCGQGSIPARNHILEFSRSRGEARHWVVDDNIKSMARLNGNRRLVVRGGGIFAAMEDFVDRYENITLAGPHHKGFVPDRTRVDPLLWNSRVYSCILIDNTIPFSWRGKYNEDTDLSLRVLKSGKCTLLFRSLLMDKGVTSRGDGKSTGTPGGNSEEVYKAGDYRKEFADALAELHPDVVQTVWKYGRYHHSVDYRPFANNKPILKPGVVVPACINEYGMTLVQSQAGEETETE